MRDTGQQLIQDRIEYLREHTDFVATLFESLIGYAIIAADFDGNIIAFNKGASQIYGYAAQEIIGKQGIELFLPREFVEAGKLEDIIDSLSRSNLARPGSGDPGQKRGFGNPLRAISDPKENTDLRAIEKQH